MLDAADDFTILNKFSRSIDKWSTIGYNALKRNQSERVFKKVYVGFHYDTCADEIFAGLGAMYVANERFRMNISIQGRNSDICR